MRMHVKSQFKNENQVKIISITFNLKYEEDGVENLMTTYPHMYGTIHSPR